MLPKRILIMGDAGRGKSSLALRLSEKLGIKTYSTDDFYYVTKFTLVRDRQTSIQDITKVFGESTWFVEGTSKHLLEHGLEKADLIICLVFNNILYQWGTLIKRHFKRENETISGMLHLMRHVMYRRYRLGYSKDKKTHDEFIAPYNTKVIKLSSFKEINEFFNKPLEH